MQQRDQRAMRDEGCSDTSCEVVSLLRELCNLPHRREQLGGPGEPVYLPEYNHQNAEKRVLWRNWQPHYPSLLVPRGGCEFLCPLRRFHGNVSGYALVE